MENVEGGVGSVYFLCLDCWYTYFQNVDEIPCPPFKGRCSTCRYDIGLVIPCKSSSSLAQLHPWWEDGNEDRRTKSFFGPGGGRC